MKVKDLMTTSSLKYCSPETKLHNVAKLMEEGNCGALPVLDKNKKVVGIVTDRDIALALAKKHSETTPKIAVSEIMTKKVHSVHTDDDVTYALKEMRLNKIGRLPVLDGEGKLKGVLSLHNLLAQTTTNPKLEIGQLKSSEENILKTIIALSDRYSTKEKSKAKKETHERVLEEEEIW